MKTKLLKLLALAAVGSTCLLGQNYLTTWPPKPQEPICLGKTLKAGKLLLDWRRDTPHFYPEGTQVSSEIWREVYGCSNGIVVLETNIPVPYTPAQTTTTPERIDWPK